MSSVVLTIGRTWDGAVLPRGERTELRLGWTDTALSVEVDAPYAGDPPPPGPPGPTDGLWEYEVVELFVVQGDGRYVELELSPHGHHLLLALSGVRRVEARGLPVDWAPTIHPATGRFTGRATIARALFPDRPARCNAFRIRGVGPERRYEAMIAVPGEKPDFHQPATFAPWML